MENDMIYKERRRRFTLLIEGYATQADAANALGFSGPAPVSNLKQGKKNIGEDVARRLEKRAGLPTGVFLDPLNVPWITDEIVHKATIRHGYETAMIGSYEHWRGLTERELRPMTVPLSWLKAEGLLADQLKSMEMPDDSQADRIRKGDVIAVNIDWGTELLNDKLYALSIGGVYTLRRTAYQYNGSLLLTCRNDNYPDEMVPAEDIKSLDVLGLFARFQGTEA